MRVYELARIVGVTSKDLIAELKRIRVTVKSASASVQDKHVRKIMERFEKRKTADEIALKKKKAEQAERRRKEEEERRKREEEERKRREEEKERKRREDEEHKRREQEERRKREEEERRRREEKLSKRVPARAAASPTPEGRKAPPPAAAPAPTPARRAKKRGKGVTKPLEIIELPKIEVMRLADPRKLYAERARRRAKERKKERKGKPAEGGKEDSETVKTVVAESRKSTRRIRPSFVVAPAAKREVAPLAPAPTKPPEPRVITIHGEVTVGQFAEKAGLAASDIIAKLLSLGEPRTINQMVDSEMCELLGLEFGIEVEIVPETDEYDLRHYQVEDREDQLVPRPPVVTIMGHVDHGKTTLLDYIRSSRVVEGEVGGITQHIGAYQVSTPRGEIVFLDTPGHEAFTSMRARGALVTDIVVLVVAADDGVMPQTVEAIDHARAGQVPIIIAINKMDLPDANADRVAQELMQHNLLSEKFGGDTIFAEVSAKTGQGVDHLLEMILLQAEMLELKANPDRRAEGVVIEARIDPTRGTVATLLVQKGMLRVGDVLVIGQHCGRVRAMADEYGREVKAAGPSHPVEALALGGSPQAGEFFLAMPNEKSARHVASLRDNRRRQRLLGTLGPPAVTLETLHDLIEEGKIKEFPLILKGDVQGSIEAISQALARLPSEKIKLRILHAAVGPVTESDVNLAKASGAVIIGFGVRPDPAAQTLAEREGVEIKLYRVIYELIDDVRAAMTAALEPEYREIPMGRAEVRQTFRISKVGIVAGCYVSEGEIHRNAQVRLVRDGVVIYDGTIASLRRVKDDVEQVLNGLECGATLTNYQDIKESDILEVYEMEAIAVEL